MSRRDRQRRRRRNRGSPLRRVVALSAVLTVGALTVAALAVAGWVVNVAQSAPNLTQLHPHIPGAPSEIFAANGEPLGYIFTTKLRTPIAGNDIPQRLKDATIAIEDRRFYQHGALDYQGILRAAVKDAVSGGNGLQGGSDLTMQLVDNTYLPPSLRAQHDLKYKIEQAKLAEQIEGQHTKNWILDSYLNDVPYGTVGGQTAYGVSAASELFFDKPVQDLDLDQEALLAGLPQAPSEYNPFIDRAAAKQRRAEVLQAMANAHYITQAQADIAARHPLQVKFGDQYQAQSPMPYVFDYVKQQAEQDLCPKHPNHCSILTGGGLKIYSTIDPRKEALAQQAIADNESVLAAQAVYGTAASGPASAGLASIDPSNGHVLAIANSSSYSQTKFDYATQARRQPGSAFKVFALMTLIHDYHANPSDTFYTSKFLPAGWLPSEPTWSVHTAEESYQGTISVTKATTISDNTVFAQLVVDLGMDKFDAMAHAMGINSPLDGNPAEVIGGLQIGVTPLEMADAYGTLANGGTHIPTTIINRVVFADGSSRNFGNPPHTTVFPYDEAYEGTQVLKTVIQSGTGTAANYGCPAAGKTGTAENLDNAWFVGYTPRMVTAVWGVYPQGNNIPMANGFGGTVAAPIWKSYMQPASGGYCGDWTPPSTPFEGTAFFGPHSAGGSESNYGSAANTGAGASPYSTGGTEYGPAQPTGGAATGGAPAGNTGGVPTTAYTNPTLFAQPPQSGNTGGGGGH